MQPTVTADEPISSPLPKPMAKSLTEDWWAVILGGVIIFAVLLLNSSGVSFHLPVYQWSGAEELFRKVLAADNLLRILETGVVFLALASFSIALSGGSVVRFAGGFAFLYLLVIVSFIIAGNKSVAYYGLEYVVFALLIGLLFGNFTALPAWLKEAVRSEFYIKTGLVILGTTILSSDLIKAGLPGIVQAVIVVTAVWFFSLWLSRKLKVDDEFGVILASAVSICGVSAAIVAAGAINGDKKKLSYVTTLVLLMAIPMLIIQPWIIKVLHIPEIVGGAWLGGTLDTTASVAAAGQLVGPAAVKAGVIAKFSQNVFIGVTAFFIAIWWAYKKPGNAGSEAGPGTEGPGAGSGVEEEGRLKIDMGKPGLKLVWERFPKFVLGFIAVSLVFSFLLTPATVKSVAGVLNSLRTVWFALAFIAIGMEAKFADLVKIQGGRPAFTFVGAQIFNIFWTLLWSYLLFGGYIFPVPDFK
ncbi:MAG TPA: putative sulfate exporter family transporter [Puia sp.]|nr:putative sulfate exporter family transporter [Puia sp.]